MFVAKLCSVEDLGRFALAFAWATPVMLAARMQLRYVLAADAGGKLPFGLAAQARALTSVTALIAIGLAAIIVAEPETARIVILASLIRAAEDVGDLLLGLAQRLEAWPLITRSLLLRGLGAAAVFGACLAGGARLPAAMALIAAWQSAVTALHDWPAVRPYAGPVALASWRRALGAVRGYAALGGAAALVSLNTYAPRYAVERFLGLEALGVYSALAQLALMGNLAVQAVGQAAVAPLGRSFEENRQAFLGRLRGLVAFAVISGAGGLGLAHLAGSQVLALVYTPRYAGYQATLVWLMAAAAFTYLTAVLGYALVAAGEREAQLRIFALSSAVALGASLAATPVWGLSGAVVALLLAWGVAAAGAGGALVRRLRACPAFEPSPKLSTCPATNSARPDAAR